MSPEESADALMFERMDASDPGRIGTFIEVGCGTSNFSFVEAAKRGWTGEAVEPLPCSALRTAVNVSPFDLHVCVIDDHDGESILHLHPNGDAEFASLRADWLGGASVNLQTVEAKTWPSFLCATRIGRITGLKMDMEGSEVALLRQLTGDVLPDVIQLEYGGGGSRESGHGGWTNKGIANTTECFSILARLEYNHYVAFDYPTGDRIEICHKDSPVGLNWMEFISTESHYGNIVAWRQP